jgi:hypothetical protein
LELSMTPKQFRYLVITNFPLSSNWRSVFAQIGVV